MSGETIERPHDPVSSDNDIDDTASSLQRNPVRGRAKSGRVWKTVQLRRHSSIRKGTAYHSPWNVKQVKKLEDHAVRQLSKEIRDVKKQEKQEMKEKRLENERRRLENQRKAEIVQVVKNTAKLKRMKKKQLRRIEKRDIANVSQATA